MIDCAKFWRIVPIALAAMAALCLGAEEKNRARQWPLLDEVSGVMSPRGLFDDRQKLEKKLVKTLLQQVGPLAGLYTTEEMEEYKHRRNGYRDCAGLTVEAGDPYPAVSSILHPGDIPIQNGAAILSVDGASTKEKDIFKVYGALQGYGEEPLQIVYSNVSYAAAATTTVEQAAVQMPPLMGADWLPRDIGYIKMRGIYGDLAPAKKALAQVIGRADSLGTIIDLRGACGTGREGVLELIQVFRGGAEVVFQYESLRDGTATEYARKPNDAPKSPVIVLVDKETCGSSELFAAAAKASKAGLIVLGNETKGDLLLREFTRLSTGEYIYLPAYDLQVPGGTEYKGASGVMPDIVVDPEQSGAWGAGTDYDPYYERKSAEGEDVNRRLAKRLGSDVFLRRAVDILLGIDALELKQ